MSIWLRRASLVSVTRCMMLVMRAAVNVLVICSVSINPVVKITLQFNNRHFVLFRKFKFCFLSFLTNTLSQFYHALVAQLKQYD